MRRSLLYLSVALVAAGMLFPLHMIGGHASLLGIPARFSQAAFVAAGLALTLTALPGIIRRRDRLDGWAAVFFGALALSIAASVDRRNSVMHLAGFFGRGFCFFFLMRALVSCERERDMALNLISAAALVVSYIGIIEAIAGYVPLLDAWYAAGNQFYDRIYFYRGGIISTVGHPVALGAALVPFFPVMLEKFAKAQSARDRSAIYNGLGALAVLAAVAATFSRAAWAGILLSVFAMVCLKWSKEGASAAAFARRMVAWLLAAAVIAVAAFAAVKIFPRQAMHKTPYEPKTLLGIENRFSPGKIMNDFIYSHRAAAFRCALSTVGSRPATGLGYGNYSRIDLPPGTPGINPAMGTPDSQLVRIIVETGVVGIIGLAVFMFVLVRRVKTFPIPLAAGLAAMALTFLVFDAFYWTPVNSVFWALAGLAAWKPEDAAGKPEN